MDEELKPCPFCGSTGIEGPFPFDRGNKYWVIRCGAPNCNADQTHESPKRVIEAWNQRI